MIVEEERSKEGSWGNCLGSLGGLWRKEAKRRLELLLS
jgi:hypothetical protein